MSDAATVIPAQQLDIPELSLVVLVGASGSGKSTFAAKHFLSTEVLSSDYCRALVADDENDQSVTNEAFELLHFIAAKRMAGGRLTVVEFTEGFETPTLERRNSFCDQKLQPVMP